jgi:hypothetical protein
VADADDPTEDTPRPAGPIVDDLAITLDLNDTDRVTEALILAKCQNLETGSVSLIIASNDLDWIQIGGLMMAADQVLRRSEPHERD